MKTTLVTFFISVALSLVGNASEPTFFETRGKYALSPDLTLNISKGDAPGKVEYMLNYTKGGGNGGIVEIGSSTIHFCFSGTLKLKFYGRAHLKKLDISMLISPPPREAPLIVVSNLF